MGFEFINIHVAPSSIFTSGMWMVGTVDLTLVYMHAIVNCVIHC